MMQLITGTQALWMRSLGWTLVHSIWEGAAIATCLAIILCITRSSRIRYTAACVAIFGALAAFGTTFAWMLPQERVELAAPMNSDAPTAVMSALSNEWLVPKSDAMQYLADSLPWIALLWIAGVMLFQIRGMVSWLLAQRLRSRGVCAASSQWQEQMNLLGARVKVWRPVGLLESGLAEVPVVIGYLRPVILVPAGLLAGMPRQQMEAILLHELAHVRRHDYLVNLMQTFVEGMLFYHPAVWWISGVIRAERENCCDDLVVQTSGDAHTYAIALGALEQGRSNGRQAALAATGGLLIKRIRRLLGRPGCRIDSLTPLFSAVTLAIGTALILGGWQVKPAETNSIVRFPAQVRAAAPGLSPYEKWLNEDVVYIITDEERAVFQGLDTDGARERFIEQFWLRRDPTPATAKNEFKQEHYRRIAYVNERFGAAGQAGWKTDRGRTYIKLGPPNEIESHPSGGNYQRSSAEGGGNVVTFPFEEWSYRGLNGATFTLMEFVDQTKSGDYRLTTDPRAKEVPR